MNKYSNKSGLFLVNSIDIEEKDFIENIRVFFKSLYDSNQAEAISSQFFAKVDLPFEIPSVKGGRALYIIKKIFVSLNFNTLVIKYAIHIGILVVGGTEILKICGQGFF